MAQEVSKIEKFKIFTLSSNDRDRTFLKKFCSDKISYHFFSTTLFFFVRASKFLAEAGHA